MEKDKGANDYQVGGQHYKSSIQHWDYVVANDLDYFQAQITKYVTRHKKKHGITDLEKARHFLDKYIELEKAKNVLGTSSSRINAIPYPNSAGRTEHPAPFGFNPSEHN